MLTAYVHEPDRPHNRWTRRRARCGVLPMARGSRSTHRIRVPCLAPSRAGCASIVLGQRPAARDPADYRSRHVHRDRPRARTVEARRRRAPARASRPRARDRGAHGVGDSVARQRRLPHRGRGRRRRARASTPSRRRSAARSLGRLAPGPRVNVEPALRAGEPLGGHIVQGHVDGVGRVRSLEPEGDGARLAVELPAEIVPLLRREGLDHRRGRQPDHRRPRRRASRSRSSRTRSR